MRNGLIVHANTTRVSLRRPRRETPKRVGDNSTGFRPTMLCRYYSKETQLFVTDGIWKRCFLVDTRAQVSVTPAPTIDKQSGPQGPPLQAANGTTITSYGAHIVPLRFGGRIFQARLIAADVKRSPLGADFLRQHNLLVEIRNHRLIEADTFYGISCSISSAWHLWNLPVINFVRSLTSFLTS